MIIVRMCQFSFLYCFAFATNADAAEALVFGKDMDTWLIYTLIFLAITSIAFIWVWLVGLVRDRKAGRSIQEPWQ